MAAAGTNGVARGAEAAWEQPVAGLRGVGPALCARLARLGIERVADVLYLLPARYEDRTAVRPLGSLRPGDKALVEGEVEVAEVVFRKRRSLLCRLADRTGGVTLRFFHFSATQQKTLARGARLRCFGEVRAGPTGLEMVHPEYRLVGAEEGPLSHTLTPIYPSTEGLHQQRLRAIVDQALMRLTEHPPVDYLADQLPAGWPSLEESVRSLHRPPADLDPGQLLAGRHPWQRRLALEELVAQRLGLKQSAARAEEGAAIAIEGGAQSAAVFRAALPFELTGAQVRAAEAVLADLARTRPMHRLLQGDVGCGKTAVAAVAAFAAARAECQTAVMAPTELLAEQHYASFARWLDPLGVRLAMLTGSLAGTARSDALRRIADGEAQVVIGTHALFQEAVTFARLALIVVDEQHRFGVEQRLRLKLKGRRGRRLPHQLIMTATPIPRTLAMTVYADLDSSTIDELPPGRQKVATVVMPDRRRAELVARLTEHCRQGRQAYWVCPLIEESELLDSEAAQERARELAEALPQLVVGLIHGRMKAAEKERVMRGFKAGAVDLLVATTVIEVGVDVPNATLMVIENSERMGLAQLHQLRGRVGRGTDRSSCVLLYKPPLSEVARERLRVMRATTDGFRVANKDLELRGPGEVLGTRQTGMLDLRIADLARDADLLTEVAEISDRLLAEHPERVLPLIRRWVRGAQEYAKV